MEYRPLGNTGLTASVAGVRRQQPSGPGSRRQLRRLRRGREYGGRSRRQLPRHRRGLWHRGDRGRRRPELRPGQAGDLDQGPLQRGRYRETVTRRVEAALRRLGLGYVDIFHFHAVNRRRPMRSSQCPGARAREAEGTGQGAPCRHHRDQPQRSGTADALPGDPGTSLGSHHAGLQPDEPGRAARIFPVTRPRGIGTLLMFVVRNLFSHAAYRPTCSPSWSRKASSTVDPGRGRSARVPRRRRRVRKASRTPRIATRVTSRKSTSFSSEPATRLTWRTMYPRLDPPSTLAATGPLAASRLVRTPDRRWARPTRPCQKVT